MKVDLSFDLDTEDCFDLRDLTYEIKRECIKQILKSICIGTLPKHPTEVLADEIMKDKEVISLMSERKEQMKEILKKEIDDYAKEKLL